MGQSLEMMWKTGTCFWTKDIGLSLYLMEKFRRKKFRKRKKKEWDKGNYILFIYSYYHREYCRWEESTCNRDQFRAFVQQYVNQELSDLQAGFQRSRGNRGKIANIHWIMEKAREFHKNVYFCLIDYTKTFDCVGNNKLWKILKKMGLLSHFTCLLRNLYADQETIIRTRYGTTDWEICTPFKTRKGV